MDGQPSAEEVHTIRVPGRPGSERFKQRARKAYREWKAGPRYQEWLDLGPVRDFDSQVFQRGLVEGAEAITPENFDAMLDEFQATYLGGGVTVNLLVYLRDKAYPRAEAMRREAEERRLAYPSFRHDDDLFDQIAYAIERVLADKLAPPETHRDDARPA